MGESQSAVWKRWLRRVIKLLQHLKHFPQEQSEEVDSEQGPLGRGLAGSLVSPGSFAHLNCKEARGAALEPSTQPQQGYKRGEIRTRVCSKSYTSPPPSSLADFN